MKKILICLMLAILCAACSNYQVGNKKETYQMEHWLQYYKDVKGWDKMITIDRYQPIYPYNNNKNVVQYKLKFTDDRTKDLFYIIDNNICFDLSDYLDYTKDYYKH